MGCPPCKKFTPIPTPDASHSSSKVFEKSGRARTNALVSFFLALETLFLVFLSNGM